MFRLPPVWSPDSKKLLFADKEARLFYVDIDQKKPVLIDQGKYADITDYIWSPDSKWVAYAKTADNRNQRRSISTRWPTGRSRRLPPAPATARRLTSIPKASISTSFPIATYNEVLGVYDFEFANPKAGRVYIVTLRADEPSPLPVLSDEVTSPPPPDVLLTPTPAGQKQQPPEQPPQPAATKTKKTPPAQAEQQPGAEKTAQEKRRKRPKNEQQPGTRPLLKNFRIDLDGIQNRIVALPIPPGNLQNLAAAKGVIYYVTVAGLRAFRARCPARLPPFTASI